MRSLSADRRSVGAPTAVAIVVLVFGLQVATSFAIGKFGLLDPVSRYLGLGVWIPWLAYPGLVAVVAVRSRSELAVTAVAMLLPALPVAAYFVSSRFQLTDSIVPLAVAAGVFAGTWAGTSLMRADGPMRAAIGLVIAGGVGGVVVVVFGILGLLLHSATTY